MDCDMKKILEDDIRRKSCDYYTLKHNLEAAFDRGFDSGSFKMECYMIETLTKMIEIKDEIRNIELMLYYHKEEQ